MRHYTVRRLQSAGFRRLGGALVVVAAVALTAPCYAADLKAAQSSFEESCAACHGKDGKGDGPKAAQLNTKPANYTDCAAMSKFDDDYLVKIVKGGGDAVGKSKEMPPFSDAFEDEEIKGLVAYIRSFCAK